MQLYRLMYYASIHYHTKMVMNWCWYYFVVVHAGFSIHNAWMRPPHLEGVPLHLPVTGGHTPMRWQEVTHPCDGRRPHAHAMAGGHTPFLDKPMQARGGKGLAGSPVFSFPPRSRAWCAQALYALARKICCAVNSILFHTDNKIWTWCIHLSNMIQGRMTYKIMNQIIR